MSDVHAVNHPYHLVEPSVWPMVGSMAAGLLTGGGVMWLHGHPAIGMVLGFVAVMATMFFWWRQIVREALDGHSHTPVVRLGLRYGMMLFICSEVMFFVAFFWAFFHSSLLIFSPASTVWPPEGIMTFDAWDLPFMNTLILLLSGATVTWAHHALIEGDRDGMLKGLGITVLLGISFTALQAYEYSHAAFGFTDGIYSSVFYMATGFHGAHVIIGTIFLAICWIRAYKGHFKPDSHFGFEAAAWYWHFVDVVWLFLFIWVYWWGA